MIKRKILTALSASAFVVVGGYAASVVAATTTGSATAVIVAPISVAPNGTNVLSFGDISPNTATPGTVTVGPGGTVTAFSGVGLAGGIVDFGGFNVTGCNGCAFVVTVPAVASTLTGVTFGATMTVDTWTSTDSGPNLSGTGTGTVNVGATLNVGANQTADTYNGTYVLTVDYP